MITAFNNKQNHFDRIDRIKSERSRRRGAEAPGTEKKAEAESPSIPL